MAIRGDRKRAKAGHRSREWTAVGASELDVVREMAQCLGLIREGEFRRSERST